MLTRACSLLSLSHLWPDGPNCNFLVNAQMEKYKKVIKKNKFKISALPIWNEEFELHDGSYSVSSDIQENLIISSKNMRQLLITLQ